MAMPDSQQYSTLISIFLTLKSDYFKYGFSAIVTCAFLGQENIFKPKNNNIFHIIDKTTWFQGHYAIYYEGFLDFTLTNPLAYLNKCIYWRTIPLSVQLW